MVCIVLLLKAVICFIWIHNDNFNFILKIYINVSVHYMMSNTNLVNYTNIKAAYIRFTEEESLHISLLTQSKLTHKHTQTHVYFILNHCIRKFFYSIAVYLLLFLSPEVRRLGK